MHLNSVRTRLCFLLFCTGFLSSCTKVINLELEKADAKYVIEGIITNEPSTCRVLLTQTNNFNDDNSFDKVENASVTIFDSGTIVQLTQAAPGIYETKQINGTPGHN